MKQKKYALIHWWRGYSKWWRNDVLSIFIHKTRFSSKNLFPSSRVMIIFRVYFGSEGLTERRENRCTHFHQTHLLCSTPAMRTHRNQINSPSLFLLFTHTCRRDWLRNPINISITTQTPPTQASRLISEWVVKKILQICCVHHHLEFRVETRRRNCCVIT